MTTAHVEKFSELLGKDPALLAKLGLDKVNADAAAVAASAAVFFTNAVKEAKAHGLEFTEEEAQTFFAEAKAAASGEPYDTQLDAVAGAGAAAHVKKFAELLDKKRALLAKLGLDKLRADAAAASASAAAFITNAVKEAKVLGLQFTDDEAQDFFAEDAKAAARGELSILQLDAVAGGGLFGEFFKELGIAVLSQGGKAAAQGTAQGLGQVFVEGLPIICLFAGFAVIDHYDRKIMGRR